MTPPRRARRGYIDWLRGLAVVIMIEAHTLDSWTGDASRDTLAFSSAQLVAGWGAPIFLFLAGVSVALASGACHRRATGILLAPPAPLSPLMRKSADKGERRENGRPHEVGRQEGVATARWEGIAVRRAGEERRAAFSAAAPMIRRGAQIFILALLFRMQAWLLSPGATVDGMLKVDILNIMGPAISGAAVLWALAPRAVPRIVTLAAVASALGLLTPIVRTAEWIAVLPDPLEWYLRPSPGRTTFSMFPWTGFLFAGAAIGVLIDRARDPHVERRLNERFAIAGVAIGVAALAATLLPSPYQQSSFWTSSPCFFFLRVGVLILLLPIAYAWEHRPFRWWIPASARGTGGQADWSPLQQFGRTSLFIYWIHVEMIYGIVSYPLHRTLTLPQTFAAFVLFTLAMYGLSVWKTRIANRWNDFASRPQPRRRPHAGVRRPLIAHDLTRPEYERDRQRGRPSPPQG